MAFRSDYHDLVRRDVLPLVPANAGAVLDFGGGRGATSAALCAQGRATRAVLLDQVAEHRLPGVDGEAVDFDDHAALEDALVRNGPFDTILALDVLEHLKDPWRTVHALDRAMTDQGTMIISVPNMSAWEVVAPLLLRGRFDYEDAGIRDRTHLRWFTRHSAIALATCSGLKLQAVQANIGRRKGRYFNAATFGLLERFTAMQYVIAVKKESTR
ncbi:methyltransferase domain-containing protein [Altererythrobacter aerius]|uniref:Methyltransferase domain-containing protein n=1 Tax=Tsuneonella aeria TaxID=1837929 RepID=A0A6I4TDB4_9SPHN|nr:class I SAM-dependent methyltransferase [Tsuneonella aeria]MXO74637.1 methyltransferase domain-containing protein [Tsuneonella aeria]